MVCAVLHRMFLNVGYDLTEKQVRLFFDEFGPVTDVYLPRQANGRNKGFGFATFSDAEALQAALKVSAHVIEGFTVQVKRAGPRPTESDGSASRRTKAIKSEDKPSPVARGACRLYVGGVADVISVSRIVQHFEAWGRVVDLSACGENSTNRTKDYFVTFDNAYSAETAHDKSSRCLGGWPLAFIKTAASSKTESQAEIQTASAATQQATATKLQSQIAAAGCQDLQQYAAWLQAQFQMLASGIATEHAIAVTANSTQQYGSFAAPESFPYSPLHSTAYNTGSSSASHYPPPASTCAQTMAQSDVNYSIAFLASQSPTATCTEQQRPSQQALSTAYVAQLAQDVSPVSPTSLFPAWSTFSASSDVVNMSYTDGAVFCTDPAPLTTDYSALALQDRLCKLYETAMSRLPEQSASSVESFGVHTASKQQGNLAVGSKWNMF